MNRRIIMVAAISGIAAVAGVLDAACSRDARPSGADLAQLERDTGVRWITVSNNAFGTTSYLYPTSPPPAALVNGSTPETAAKDFFAKYAAVFQMVDPEHELTAEASGAASGLQFASFSQTEGAASVYGTRLTVVFDADGRIAFVSGLYVPGLHALSTSPALSPDEAAAKARADMATRYPASVLVSLEQTPPPVLTIYAIGHSPALAYSMLVSYAADSAADSTARQRVPMFYVVDATSGAILQAVSAIESQYSGPGAVAVTASGIGEIDKTPRSFPALATEQGGGSTAAPYYMQVRQGAFGGAPRAPLFVRTPDTLHPPVVTSNDPTKWDLPTASSTNSGSAVDAYVYLGQVDAWWQARGRNGYDDYGGSISDAGQLGVLVHEDFFPGIQQKPCVDNAYWDHYGTIHVCASSALKSPYIRYATSSDLVVMGHEFQHAVTDLTLGLVYRGESGALNESLSDIFGELIAHGTPGASADCVIGDVFDPEQAPARPVAGLRNMIDPHRSGAGRQPDNINDSAYYKLADNNDLVHTNSGVPNKAWSLMTFGGQDHTAPNLSVPNSLALGWDDSEKLYLSLIDLRPISPTASFADVAYPLIGLAGAKFGRDSRQQTAVACAWYAVGVLSESDMRSKVEIDPCSCSGADAGTCDAGSDAAADGMPDAKSAAGPLSCLATLEGGAPFLCVTYAGFERGDDTEACVDALASMGLTMAEEVSECPITPSPLGCCNPGTGAAGTGCYYPFEDPDADGGDSLAEQEEGFQAICALSGGTWSMSGGGGSMTGTTSDAGTPHDAGKSHDAADDADAGPPHC